MRAWILVAMQVEIWMEKQYLSQREVDLEAYFTRNHSILEGARFKRAIFQGRYCRNFGCCEDRDDGCVTEFYEANALCYCDKFCDRENSDCCPDYKSFCHEEKEWDPHTQPWYPEVPAPPGCFKDGQRYEEGSVIKENCNSCTCSGQQWKCSQHVCLVRPELIEQVNKGDYGMNMVPCLELWRPLGFCISLAGNCFLELPLIQPSWDCQLDSTELQPILGNDFRRRFQISPWHLAT
uniref:Tubulointerstitial nephritis antigen n=1 Tax=Callithrix jacchus TaxID=9483 RepID=A0A2R8MGW2_CALJA